MIEINGFQLRTPQVGSGFDLHQKVVSEKKDTGEKYDSTKIIGYNMPIDYAIRTIADIGAIGESELLTIQEYLDRYENILNEIKNMFKN